MIDPNEYWRYVEAAAETAHDHRHGDDADTIPAILARNTVWTREVERALVVLSVSGDRSAVLHSREFLAVADGETLADAIRDAATLCLADDIARAARRYAYEAGEGEA